MIYHDIWFIFNEEIYSIWGCQKSLYCLFNLHINLLLDYVLSSKYHLGSLSDVFIIFKYVKCVIIKLILAKLLLKLKLNKFLFFNIFNLNLIWF